MTGRWPPADLPGLSIDGGQCTRPWSADGGRWIRPPTADYRCGRCGAVESASGDAVPAFVNTVKRTHRAVCPANQQGVQAA